MSLFRENFVCYFIFSKSENTESPYYPLLFMIEIPTFALLFPNFSPALSLLFLWSALESLISSAQRAISLSSNYSMCYSVSCAKVLCILHHRGVQLILAYSWARPAILVVGKGRGGMFLFLLFLHFHSCSSFFPVPLFHLLYSLFYLFSPFLWETTQNDPQGLTCR